MLKRLLTGMYAIGMDKQSAWRVLTKVGLDSIPALRFAIMETLAEYDGRMSTNDLAAAVRHPATTTRRSCEDLVAHGLLEMTRQGEGKAHLWDLSGFTANRLRTVQETLPDRQADALKTVSEQGVERVPFNGSGISGKVNSRTTEPNQEGFPEMSVSQETVPEIPEGVSSKPLPNQIPGLSGTVVNGTNRNSYDIDPDEDPGAWAQPLEPASANGNDGWDLP
jgi:hypothetical protein